MPGAFYRQISNSVGIHKIEQAMEILHALMCKSTFELTWLSRLEKFFAYVNLNFIMPNLRSCVCPRKFDESWNSEMPAQLSDFTWWHVLMFDGETDVRTFARKFYQTLVKNCCGAVEKWKRQKQEGSFERTRGLYDWWRSIKQEARGGYNRGGGIDEERDSGITRVRGRNHQRTRGRYQRWFRTRRQYKRYWYEGYREARTPGWRKILICLAHPGSERTSWLAGTYSICFSKSTRRLENQNVGSPSVRWRTRQPVKDLEWWKWVTINTTCILWAY